MWYFLFNISGIVVDYVKFWVKQLKNVNDDAKLGKDRGDESFD